MTETAKLEALIRAELERMNDAGCLTVYEMSDDRGLTIDEYTDLFAAITRALSSRPAVKGPDELDDGWVVIKRGLYWRPNRQGYTGILSQAGIYSDEESAALSDGVEVTRQRFKDAAEVMPATYTDIERDYWREEALRLRILSSLSPPTGNGWRPIDTAPKDGTVVDIWIDGHRIPDAWFGRPVHSCGEAGSLCDSCPSYDGWCDCFGYITGPDGHQYGKPTHWQPLPSPPEAE